MMLLGTGACFLNEQRQAGMLAPTIARSGQADMLAEEATSHEAQIRRWRQLVMADGSAAPLVITISSPVGAGGDLVVARRLAAQLRDRGPAAPSTGLTASGQSTHSTPTVPTWATPPV